MKTKSTNRQAGFQAYVLWIYRGVRALWRRAWAS
jgi:hypothetical protein